MDKDDVYAVLILDTLGVSAGDSVQPFAPKRNTAIVFHTLRLIAEGRARAGWGLEQGGQRE